MPRRELSEEEFNAIRKKVLAMAPSGLSEADFNRWSARMGRNLMVSEIAEAEQKPPALEGTAVGRFLGGAADAVGGAIKGTAGLSVDFFQIKTSAGTVQSKINLNGSVYCRDLFLDLNASGGYVQSRGGAGHTAGFLQMDATSNAHGGCIQTQGGSAGSVAVSLRW